MVIYVWHYHTPHYHTIIIIIIRERYRLVCRLFLHIIINGHMLYYYDYAALHALLHYAIMPYVCHLPLLYDDAAISYSLLLLLRHCCHLFSLPAYESQVIYFATLFYLMFTVSWTKKLLMPRRLLHILFSARAYTLRRQQHAIAALLCATQATHYGATYMRHFIIVVYTITTMPWRLFAIALLLLSLYWLFVITTATATVSASYHAFVVSIYGTLPSLLLNFTSKE